MVARQHHIYHLHTHIHAISQRVYTFLCIVPHRHHHHHLHTHTHARYLNLYIHVCIHASSYKHSQVTCLSCATHMHKQTHITRTFTSYMQLMYLFSTRVKLNSTAVPPNQKIKIPRYKFKFNRKLNLNLYRQIPRNLRFSIWWISGMYHFQWNLSYGVALVSRIDKIIGLFCKRALQKRQYSAKQTYNFIDPTDRSHPIPFQRESS